MLNITAQMLEEYRYFNIRLEDVSDNMSQDDEMKLANQIVANLHNSLRERGLSTKVLPDWAQCGNVVHPLIRLVSEKNYGSIGLLLSRSLVSVVCLSYGKNRNLMLKQEELRNKSQYLNQKLTRWGNYTDGSGVGNVIGLANQQKDMKMVKDLSAAANSIQYDPTELLWEQEWENDVLSLIKQVFGAG